MTVTPAELISLPTPNGFKALKPKRITLTAANNTSATPFTSQANNRILFNLPAYVSTFLNTQRSFFSFKGVCQSSTATDNVKFVDGIPVIDRLVIRANGLLLSDVREYGEIERIMANFGDYVQAKAKAYETGDFRSYLDEMADGTTAAMENKLDAFIVGQQRVAQVSGEPSGAVFRKYLAPASILTTDKMLPLGLLSSSGGYAMQIEMYLADADKAVEVVPGSTLTAGAQLSYALTEVQMNLELLELPADIYAEFTSQLLMGGRFILPFTTWRVHKSYLPMGNDKYDIAISEAAKNVSTVISVLRAQSSKSLEFLGGARAGATTGSGGSKVWDDRIARWQMRYGTQYYPQSPLEHVGNDNKLSLEHALAGLDMLEAGRPVCSTMMMKGNGAGNVLPRWEEKDFALVQSFKSTRDAIDNGISTLNSGAPLLLDLSFQGKLTQGLELFSFIEESMNLIIGANGQVGLEE